LSLARRLPQLAVAARRVAATVAHGVHGRRRAGLGENFWQFRPLGAGESRQRIDWRRSARDDRLTVREREWESAHTVMLWADRSPSMAFRSSLASEPKIDRALTLALAAADLLVRGGERVGFCGLARAVAARDVVDRLTQALMAQEKAATDFAHAETPPLEPLPARAQAMIFSDGLRPLEDWRLAIETLAAHGAGGHFVAIADPVEETFPFAGHVEFFDLDSDERLRFGEAASLRDTYLRRLSAHREGLADICRAHGWSFAVHRTDAAPAQALLALRTRLDQDAYREVHR
jgi:uncharacterized protein (DUF58 family)